MTLIEIMQVYEGSNGDATKALYDRLTALGPVGIVATNLFRAHKNSARAKVYRGGGYRGQAYERKQWAMDNLARELAAHGDVLQGAWGWAEDAKQEYHRWVLYVDLPTGQVSFHTAARGEGPDYTKPWDGVRDAGAGRICSWIAAVFREQGAQAA
jgi:hypothetical protein